MIISKRITNPGELRTPITLQEPTITKDTGGAQRASWTAGTPVYAKWENLHGTEVWAAAQAGEAVSAATVRIRYRSDVSARTSILKKNVRYEIVAIDNIQEHNEYLELSVQRVTGTV